MVLRTSPISNPMKRVYFTTVQIVLRLRTVFSHIGIAHSAEPPFRLSNWFLVFRWSRVEMANQWACDDAIQFRTRRQWQSSLTDITIRRNLIELKHSLL